MDQQWSTQTRCAAAVDAAVSAAPLLLSVTLPHPPPAPLRLMPADKGERGDDILQVSLNFKWVCCTNM